MKITYDPSYGQTYIYVKPRPDHKAWVKKSVEVQKNVILDFDAEGELVGIELIGHTILEGLRKAGDVEFLGGVSER